MADTLVGRLLEAALKAVVYALWREQEPDRPKHAPLVDDVPVSPTRTSPVSHKVGAYTRTHPSGKVVNVRGYERGNEQV